MPIGLNQFINLNDQQLYQMAEYQTALGADNSKLANNSLLYGIPLIDSFTRAAMNPGTMDSKAMTFTNRMLGWVGFFALASIYNNAIDSVKETFPAVKKFDKDHPVLSTVLNVMGLWVGIDYAYKGIKKLNSKLIEKYPEKFEKFQTQKADLFKKMNNPWLEEHLYKPISKGMKYMESKFPESTKGLKAVAPWVAPIIVAGAFTKSLCMLNDMKNNTQANFNHLKQIQEQFREQMYR